MRNHNSPCLSALTLCLAFAGAASADVPTLTGVWTIDEWPAMYGSDYPGSVVFSRPSIKDGVHGYHVELIQRNEHAQIETTRLLAHWDGQTLRMFRDAGPGGGGIVGALSGPTPGTPSNPVRSSTYLVHLPDDPRRAQLDLQWLRRVHTSLYDWTPTQLRRIVPATDPDAMPEYLRPVRAPAEWEPAEEITWGAQDSFDVVSIYAAAIRATAHEDVVHRIFVTHSAAEAQVRYELAARGVTAAKMQRVRVQVYDFRSVWIRDYGPLVVKGQTWNAGGTALVDDTSGQVVDAEGRTEARIVVDTGYFPHRPIDDSLPGQYARQRNWLRRDVESLKFEGGNFMTDGAGRVFTTTAPFEEGVNMKDGVNRGQEHIEDRLRDLGAREVFFFERMPQPEGTGHIDMFAKLHDRDTVLVGSCQTPQAFKEVLDRNADRFAHLGYEVIRLPMASGERLMTYTNSLYVGSTVLVPTYGSPADAQALDTYRSLGWHAVGIDSRQVIKANGAIHCVSMQIPR